MDEATFMKKKDIKLGNSLLVKSVTEQRTSLTTLFRLRRNRALALILYPL